MRHDNAKGAAGVTVSWDRRAFWILVSIVGALILANLISHALRFGLDITSRQSFGFIRLFDLNEESNVPTWFSSVMLLFCATLLSLIALAKRATGDPWVRYWFALGLIFLFMSMDETATIHERIIRPLHNLFDLGPSLTNAWVIIAWPLVIILFLFYMKFLLNLPRRTAYLFCGAGIVYLSGVIGVEILSGLMKFNYGTGDLRFALTTTIEESLEMLGLVLFIYGMADYAGRERFVWQLTFQMHRREGEIQPEQERSSLVGPNPVAPNPVVPSPVPPGGKPMTHR